MKQGIKDFTQVLHNEKEIVMYSILVVIDVLEEHKKYLQAVLRIPVVFMSRQLMIKLFK